MFYKTLRVASISTQTFDKENHHSLNIYIDRLVIAFCKVDFFDTSAKWPTVRRFSLETFLSETSGPINAEQFQPIYHFDTSNESSIYVGGAALFSARRWLAEIEQT